jgi:hypothetical protein
MAYSKCLPTRLNPLAETTCCSQVVEALRRNLVLTAAHLHALAPTDLVRPASAASAASAASGAATAAVGAAFAPSHPRALCGRWRIQVLNVPPAVGRARPAARRAELAAAPHRHELAPHGPALGVQYVLTHD